MKRFLLILAVLFALSPFAALAGGTSSGLGQAITLAEGLLKACGGDVEDACQVLRVVASRGEFKPHPGDGFMPASTTPECKGEHEWVSAFPDSISKAGCSKCSKCGKIEWWPGSRRLPSCWGQFTGHDLEVTGKYTARCKRCGRGFDNDPNKAIPAGD